MSKKTAAAAKTPAAPANNNALPLIDKQPEVPTVQAQVGVLTPNMLQYPTHEQLVAILLILGLQTQPFHGQDKDGNLVNEAGNIVIPVQLRQFFQNFKVAPPTN